MYHYIKEFSQYNLELNMTMHADPSLWVWPVIAIISDSVVMLKKLDKDGKG